MKVSPAEKLILQMLCEVYEKLEIDHEIDHKFVQSALHNDQLWAFEWQYNFLQDHDHTQPNPPAVKETADILDMWAFLESAFARLDDGEKKRVLAEGEVYGDEITFAGFDANNEEHYGVATFMIDDLKRFQSFAGRDINSHSESVPAHLRMLDVFLPIRANLHMGKMTGDQIISVMKARRFA
jgi:uncharacterized protein YfbU (UPF0304 family)